MEIFPFNLDVKAIQFKAQSIQFKKIIAIR